MIKSIISTSEEYEILNRLSDSQLIRKERSRANMKQITREEFEKMQKEYLEFMAAEEKRLGIGSEEFK